MVDQGGLERKLDVEVSEEERKKYGYGSEHNLEDVVRNHRHTSPFKKFLNYVIGIGAAAASYLITGPIGPAAALLGVAGDYLNAKIRKRDFPSRQFRNTSLFWSLFAIPGSALYNWMNATFNVKVITGWIKRMITEFFCVHVALGPLTHVVRYPVDNLKSKGMYAMDLKKSMVEEL